MRTNRLFWMAGALCAALGLGSCSNEAEELITPAAEGSRLVTLTVSLPGGDADTRTAYAADGTGLKVTWAKGDKLTAVWSESNDFDKSTTFTLTSGEGTATATFTGELPSDFIAEAPDIKFNYPEVTEKEEGKGYVRTDYTKQTGKLADLGSVDCVFFSATYDNGTLTVDASETGRDSRFLHFAKGTTIGTGSGKATFKLSGVSPKLYYPTGNQESGDITISDIELDESGQLADDLYIAFCNDSSGNSPTLTIASGDVEKKYSLKNDLEEGKMYHISNLSHLTEITP